MRGIRPGTVTTTLAGSFAAMCLVTTCYAFLHVPAPSAGKAAATVDVVTAGEITRTISGMDLAAMKSKVMTYDVQHQQTQTTTAVVQPPPAKPVVVTPPSSTPPSAPPPVYHASAGMYSSAMVEALWIQEGGSPATAADDACIVSHESGGNPNAISPTADYGLDQIHDDPAALNPVVSTQVAIRMSDNGRNWSPWTTAGMCGL